jgi:predicted double-glycine peptidase
MSLWVETIGILFMAVCGLATGAWASRRSPAARLTAMALAIGLVGIILLARYNTLWDLIPPLRPIAVGRLRFILMILAVTIGLTAPLNQLRSIVSRFATCVIMSVFLAVLITLPFLGPALVQENLSNSPTLLDVDGVCIQSQPFTCGPAAAVTALKYCGFQAAEGRLAVAARTSPVIGTSPWNLYRAVKSGYGDSGLRCSFRYLGSLDAIPGDSIALVIVKDAGLSDHCVTVLDYNDQTVTIADPMEGLVSVPRAAFAEQWRHCGIILQRAL